jgi:NAD(P)-dependent dehydrogenase (short-subunit alcohol dehydrogenase family)
MDISRQDPGKPVATWFVTGVSRGIGRAIAEAVLGAGHQLLGTVRDLRDADDLASGFPGRAKIVTADVTDPDAVQTAVKTALETFGQIDVLVNNAGYTLLAGIEEATDEQIRDQFETNTFGLFRVTREVLPSMRVRRSGRIIMISSVAGVSAAPGLGYYAASKHAVEGFSESVAKEVAEHGILVTLVEPGLFRTDTLGSSRTDAQHSDAYAATAGKTRSALSSLSGHQPGDPARLAAAVLRLAAEPAPPLRLPLDPGATGAMRPSLEQRLRELDEWGKAMATAPIDDSAVPG